MMASIRTKPFVAIASLLLVAAACADDNGSDSSNDAATSVAAISTTSSPDTTAVSTTSLSATTAASATTTVVSTAPKQFGVGIREVTFTDTSRATPQSGEVAGTDQRVIDTVVLYPTSGERTDAAPFPLVVFSHGLGGTPENSQALLERWVTDGFVVAAPRFPLSRPNAPAGPDGGDVQNQTGDVSFVIDRMIAESADVDSVFAGLVDGERIGVSGHSNGGITTIGVTLHTCCADERIDAAMEFAGTASPFAGGEYDWQLAPPYLIVHGTEDALVSYANAVTLYNDIAGPKGVLTLDGGGHGAMFAAGDEWFNEVVDVTTDFWRAQLRDDTAALDRFAAAPTDSDYPNLRWDSGDGPVDVIPTTTVAGIDRQATADPATDLANGDRVTVTWSGFTPDGTVNVVQCSGGGTGGSGLCSLTTGQILLPNPTGSGSVEIEIVTGAVGEGTCDVDSDDCVIVVNDSGLTGDEASIELPLEFAG